MKPNCDFVTRADYEADLAEATAFASLTVAQLRQEIDQAKMLIWLLVNAAGGVVSIPYADVRRFDADRAALEIEVHGEDLSFRYSARAA